MTRPTPTEAAAMTSNTTPTSLAAEAVREAAAKVASSPPHEFLPLRDPSEPIGADEMLKAEGFRDAQRIIAKAIRALDLSTILASLTPATDERQPSDTVIAAKAREALGTWLAWPDAGRDGPCEVTNEQVESWLHGLPNKLGYRTDERLAELLREDHEAFVLIAATSDCETERRVAQERADAIDTALAEQSK